MYKTKFTPGAVAHPVAPESWLVLLSQRHRWSTLWCTACVTNLRGPASNVLCMCIWDDKPPEYAARGYAASHAVTDIISEAEPKPEMSVNWAYGNYGMLHFLRLNISDWQVVHYFYKLETSDSSQTNRAKFLARIILGYSQLRRSTTRSWFFPNGLLLFLLEQR